MGYTCTFELLNFSFLLVKRLCEAFDKSKLEAEAPLTWIRGVAMSKPLQSQIFSTETLDAALGTIDAQQCKEENLDSEIQEPCNWILRP